MRTLLAFILAFATAFSPAFALDINGELKKAQLEKLSSDPTGSEARVYYNTVSKTPQIYNGTAWTTLGSGAGTGLNNLVENGDAESVTVPSDWSTYDDGASAAAVDGTGGSPAQITAIARTTTAAQLVYGTGTWKMAKAAADGQGEGWAYDFTLPPKSQLYSSQVTLRFDYYFNNTDLAADSIRVYLYDRDAATLITPQFVSCGGGSTPALTIMTTTCHAELTWVSTTSDDYRLIFHVASTDADDADLYVDNLYTGDYQLATGDICGAETAYTLTVGGSSSAPTLGTNTQEAAWSRCGEFMHLRYDLSQTGAGSAGGGTYLFPLPSGYTMSNPSSVTATNAVGLGVVGSAELYDGTNGYTGNVHIYNTTNLWIEIGNHTTAPTPFASTLHSFGNTTVRVSYRARVKIAEWAGGTAFGENKVEYACSTTGTWDAAAAVANTSYGMAGCPITGSLSAGRLKAVRFQTPIGSDLVDLYIKYNNTWSLAAQIFPYQVQNTVAYGVQAYGDAVTTDFNVNFGQYQTTAGGGEHGAAGTDWSATATAWVLVKHRDGKVPFGLASADAPGLVSGEEYGTHSTVFTGARTTAAKSVAYARSGKLVSLRVPGDVSASCAADIFTASTALPSTLRPSGSAQSLVLIQNNGASTDTPGYAEVTTAGVIRVRRQLTNANFTGSANCGWFDFVITYPVN